MTGEGVHETLKDWRPTKSITDPLCDDVYLRQDHFDLTTKGLYTLLVDFKTILQVGNSVNDARIITHPFDTSGTLRALIFWKHL